MMYEKIVVIAGGESKQLLAKKQNQNNFGMKVENKV